jgi:hypothetical protein
VNSKLLVSLYQAAGDFVKPIRLPLIRLLAGPLPGQLG